MLDSTNVEKLAEIADAAIRRMSLLGLTTRPLTFTDWFSDAISIVDIQHEREIRQMSVGAGSRSDRRALNCRQALSKNSWRRRTVGLSLDVTELTAFSLRSPLGRLSRSSLY